MQLIWVMVVALAFFGLGYGQWFVEAAERTREGDTTQQFGEISKVKLDRAGTIYPNGKIVTIEGLQQDLARLKQGGSCLESAAAVGRARGSVTSWHPVVF